MKIIYWGTYDPSVARNRIIINGLRNNGVEVRCINRPVWGGLDQGKHRSRVVTAIKLLITYLLSWPVLVWKFFAAERPDALIVGYLGMFDVFVLWPVARLTNTPFYSDAFISLYNTTVEDRELVPAETMMAKALYWCEWAALHLPDRIFTDTEAHAQYFRDRFGLADDRVLRVFVGTETELFDIGDELVTEPQETLKVLFYGTLIPLHGLEVILKAVEATRQDAIVWKIIGSGQQQGLIDEFIDSTGGENLEWVPWVPYEKLTREIASADVCLGIFGMTDKAKRVIPNKVYQLVACGKPIITMESPAMKELVDEEQDGIWFVPPGDADALVMKLRELLLRCDDLRGKTFHENLRDKISPKAVTEPLVKRLGQDCI